MNEGASRVPHVISQTQPWPLRCSLVTLNKGAKHTGSNYGKMSFPVSPSAMLLCPASGDPEPWWPLPSRVNMREAGKIAQMVKGRGWQRQQLT